tara:strand:+ start:1038 stop:1601 length:564 start_codon:yes stop_codon:yes gene_type:complete
MSADDELSCSQQPPWTVVASASNGLSSIAHFTMPRDAEPDVFPGFVSCLLVSHAESNWWIDWQPGSIFEIGEFVDDRHAIIITRNVAVANSYLLNLDQGDMQFIGGGVGSLVKSGPNAGLVLLQGQKRYHATRGPFWLDVLVGLNGESVEFLPNEWGECLPVSEIIRVDESRASLKQRLTDCIAIAF